MCKPFRYFMNNIINLYGVLPGANYAHQMFFIEIHFAFDIDNRWRIFAVH